MDSSSSTSAGVTARPSAQRPPAPTKSASTKSVSTQPAPASAASAGADSGQQWSPRLWATLIVLCGALFLDALDVSMVGVALPSIKSDLSLSTSTLQWVVSGY